jgi:hypothetical protein
MIPLSVIAIVALDEDDRVRLTTNAVGCVPTRCRRVCGIGMTEFGRPG